jgi:hypothetical protein
MFEHRYKHNNMLLYADVIWTHFLLLFAEKVWRNQSYSRIIFSMEDKIW